MQMLELLEVPADDDQVHLALVLDLEVGDRLAGAVDHIETKALLPARLVAALVELEAQTVLGDRKPGDRGLGINGTVTFGGVVIFRRSLVPLLGFGPDRVAGKRGRGEDQREADGEGAQPERHHALPLTVSICLSLIS
jgi:hypothetical protein